MKKLLFMMLMTAMTLTASAQDSKEDEAAALVESGIKLHDQSKYEEAIKMYDKALKINPKNPNASYEKAFSLHCMGKNDDAIKILEKATKTVDSTTVYTNMFMLLGSIYDDTGKIDKSIEAYHKALDINNTVGDLGMEASLLYNLGITNYNAHNKLDDKDNYYAKETMTTLSASFASRPLHPRTNLYLYKIFTEYNFFCSALNHLCMLALSQSDGGVVDGIDDAINAMTKAEMDKDVELDTNDSIVIYKAIEIGKQPRSQYGVMYDVLTGVYKTLCADIKDEPFHPYEILNDSTDRDAVLCLFAKFLRDGELETMMHVLCKTSKSGHIANADWCSQNKERVDNIYKYINDTKCLWTLKEYIEATDTATTEDSQANVSVDEAKKYIQTFLSEKMNTQASVQAGNNIWQWVSSSPEVNVAIGEEETKWMNDNTTPCLIAYSCGYAMYQLEKGNKDMTAEAYLAGYKTMLKYYEENKDVIGNVPTLQNYLKLMKENPAKFEETIKNNMPKEQK